MEQIKKEKSFKEIIEEGINFALSEIIKNFEGKDNLFYHNSEHTKMVIEATKRICEALELDEREKLLAMLAGAFHDIVQGYEIKQNEFEIDKKRVFLRGENERKSAKKAIEFMERVNLKSEREIFSKEDKEKVRTAIEATIPEFDKDLKTVIQPNIKKPKIWLGALAVALADLSAAGMLGPERFLEDADKLFWEIYIGLAEALKGKMNLSFKEKEYFRKEMIKWTKFQEVEFPKGRKKAFKKEIENLPKEKREKIIKLFSKFSDTIEAAKVRFELRRKMTFEELIENMGFFKFFSKLEIKS